MTRPMIVPLIFGLTGAAILIWLALWQVQRMSWKQDMLAQIEAQMLGAPMTLDDALSASDPEFLPVTLRGTITGNELHVLTSIKGIGAVYRIIAAFEAEDGRRLLLDRGYIPVSAKNTARPAVDAVIIGNLRTPQETDKFTPPPDNKANIWFSRQVGPMARALGTEPVFVILRHTSETNPPVTPFPVDTTGIPNDHLNYALTWFSLAVAWLGMTIFLLWRIKFGTAQGLS